MGIVLEIKDLSYKDFNNINLTFEENNLYSVIGSNNCGKTTLFKLISGMIMSNDAVSYKNISLNMNNRSDYIVNFGIARRITKNSFACKSVINEMIYPLHNLGYSKSDSLDRINEVLDLFNATKYLDKNISELTYYEKQLLLLMISLLHKPSVLLLDSVIEIFPKTMKERVIKVLKKLTKDGLTVINFTNSLEDAYSSDKIILLDNYSIVGEYNKHDIYKDDKLFYEHNLEIPFLIDLSIKLKMYNLVDKEYTNMKAMVDDIWP